MILAIPFNPTLPGGYGKLTNALLRYGRHPNHTLVVLSTTEHEEGALEFAMKLREHFGRYFAVTLDDRPGSMLMTSNRMFAAAMKALADYAPGPDEMQEPVMFYFDPTWKPVKDRWLDMFQAEYYIAGAPTVYGAFDIDGGKAKVVGPVAVNRRFLQLTRLLEFLSASDHWRDYLAWEMVNSGVSAGAIGKVLPAYIRPYDP